MNFFQSLDYLSNDFSFGHKGNKNFTSIQGAIVTICILITAMILSILFGKELFDRKLPNVSAYSNFVEESEYKYNDYPMYFQIAFANGTILNDFSKFFHIFGAEISFKDSVPSIDYTKLIGKKCEKSDFLSALNLISEEEVEKLLSLSLICSYPNQIIKNDWDHLILNL